MRRRRGSAGRRYVKRGRKSFKKRGRGRRVKRVLTSRGGIRM